MTKRWLISGIVAATTLGVLAGPALPQYVTPGAPLTMNALATFLNGAFAGVGVLTNCITGVNLNAGNSDNAIAINYPSNRTRYQPTQVILDNASTTSTNATVGLYTSTGAGGSTIASTQAVTLNGSTAGVANGLQQLTMSNSTNFFYNSTAVYLHVGTANGAAVTADVCVHYRAMP